MKKSNKLAPGLALSALGLLMPTQPVWVFLLSLVFCFVGGCLLGGYMRERLPPSGG